MPASMAAIAARWRGADREAPPCPQGGGWPRMASCPRAPVGRAPQLPACAPAGREASCPRCGEVASGLVEMAALRAAGRYPCAARMGPTGRMPQLAWGELLVWIGWPCMAMYPWPCAARHRHLPSPELSGASSERRRNPREAGASRSPRLRELVPQGAPASRSSCLKQAEREHLEPISTP
ncbi:hypothetical protein Dimus_016387 [Dionaea muscipula]